jgi:hypothetical protein
MSTRSFSFCWVASAAEIFAVDRLAFVRGRIGTRDVELLVLHEIVIAVAAVRLAPSRKPRAAAGDQIAGFIAGQALGLRPLDTIFVIARQIRRWPGKKPHHDERNGSRRGCGRHQPDALAIP